MSQPAPTDAQVSGSECCQGEGHGGRHLSVGMLCTVLGIMLCCVADAFLTGQIIRQGIAVEGNPVMSRLMESGAVSFLAVKYSITGVGVIFLLVIRSRRLFGNRLLVAELLPLLQLLYVVLLCYEGFLLAGWPEWDY